MKFKIGQKVLCIDGKGSGNCLKKGQVYTIERIGLEDLYLKEYKQLGWFPWRFINPMEIIRRNSKIKGIL